MRRLLATLIIFQIVASIVASATLAQPLDIRLWAGANDTGAVVFEINNGRVYPGPRSTGQPILAYSGDRIYRGANTNGEILYTIRGDQLHVGPNAKGPVVFTLKENRIFEGPNTTGTILYRIAGKRVFEGGSTAGRIILTGNQDLENGDSMLKLLLPVLIELSRSAQIRLYADAEMTQPLYEVANGRVFDASSGNAILFFDGSSIFYGPNAYCEVLFTVDGDHLHVGSGTAGPVAYTVRHNRVFEGTDTSRPIYTVQGAAMFEGSSTAGRLVFQADRSLEVGDIRFFLPILADGQ